MWISMQQVSRIIYSAFVKYFRKNGNTMNIDFKKAYDSIRRYVLYNILI